MKIKTLIAFITCFFWITSAIAYDGITYYGADLSAKDRVNSSGTILTDVRSILQQDRANYYKFKRRDLNDQGDGYFTSYPRRLLFQKVNLMIKPDLKKRILNGTSGPVTVWVFDERTVEVTEGLPSNLN